jgi:hypothetical protein
MYMALDEEWSPWITCFPPENLIRSLQLPPSGDPLLKTGTEILATGSLSSGGLGLLNEKPCEKEMQP